MTMFSFLLLLVLKLQLSQNGLLYAYDKNRFITIDVDPYSINKDQESSDEFGIRKWRNVQEKIHKHQLRNPAYSTNVGRELVIYDPELESVELNQEILYDPPDMHTYYENNKRCRDGDVYSILQSRCIPRDLKRQEENELCERGCNNGRCLYLKDVDDTICQCFLGFTGSDCSRKIKYCNETKCLPGRCIEQHGLHVCECPGDGNVTLYGETCDVAQRIPCIPGYFGPNFKHLINRMFHPYESSPVAYIQCDKDRFYIRRCPLGTFWDQEILSCTPLKPLPQRYACKKYPCYNHGRCSSDNDETYKCFCQEPFYGSYCQLRRNYCTVSHCGGELVNGRDIRCLNIDTPPYYVCACDNGIVDTTCDRNITNKCILNSPMSYAVDEKHYVMCDPDGTGYVLQCPYGTTFNKVMQKCMSFAENSEIEFENANIEEKKMGGNEKSNRMKTLRLEDNTPFNIRRNGS